MVANENGTGAASIELDDEDASASSEHERNEKEKAKVKFCAVMQRVEAAAYFTALADGLRNGRLSFRQGEQSVSLEPADQLELQVKARKKGEKERFSFEIQWRRPARERLAPATEISRPGAGG